MTVVAFLAALCPTSTALLRAGFPMAGREVSTPLGPLGPPPPPRLLAGLRLPPPPPPPPPLVGRLPPRTVKNVSLKCAKNMHYMYK